MTLGLIQSRRALAHLTQKSGRERAKAGTPKPPTRRAKDSDSSSSSSEWERPHITEIEEWRVASILSNNRMLFDLR